jgi:hypothetical protein
VECVAEASSRIEQLLALQVNHMNMFPFSRLFLTQVQNVAQQHVIADMMTASSSTKSAQKLSSSSVMSGEATIVAESCAICDDADADADADADVDVDANTDDYADDDLLSTAAVDPGRKQQHHELLSSEQQHRSSSQFRHASCVRILRRLAAVDAVSLLLIRCLETHRSPSSSSSSLSSAAAAAAAVPRDRGSSCLRLLFARLKAIKYLPQPRLPITQQIT